MKKIFFSAAVLAMAAIGALKATENSDFQFSYLSMGNIDALANGEPGGANRKCIYDGEGCRWKKLPTDLPLCLKLHCSHY